MTTHDDKLITAAMRSVGADAPAFRGIPERSAPVQRRSRRGQSLLAAAAVVTIVAGSIGARELIPSGTDDQQQTFVAEQGPSAAPPPPVGSMDDVRETADRLSQYKLPGFGKVAVELQAKAVTVFWKGAPPVELARIAKEVEGTVSVAFVDVAFSNDELVNAGRRALTVGNERGIAVTRASQAPDLSGLVVAVSGSEMPATAEERERLRATLESIAEVPVELTEGERPEGLPETVPKP